LNRIIAVSMAVALLISTPVVEAKTYRYDSGPEAPDDTTFTETEAQLEPIVRKRGPKVPVTNLQMVTLVANTAFQRALEKSPLEPGRHILLAPASVHPLNFAIEHSVLRHLSDRQVVSTVRRDVIADDSLMVVAGNPGDAVLEYTVASARVTYVRLRGWLPGRVKIERQANVEGTLTLRDPTTAKVLWIGDAAYSVMDAFSRGQLALVEDARYPDLKSTVPSRNVDKVFEPVLVVAVVAGLVALFFQNRP